MASAGRGGRAGALAGLGGMLIGAAAVAGYYALQGPDRAATEAIVRDYILNHGEILPEAMDRLQRRQASSAVARYRAALERPYHSAWAGGADGDVVLVEFFDYACPYCRVTNGAREQRRREDRRLKVVWRELPVRGPPSQAAAEA